MTQVSGSDAKLREIAIIGGGIGGLTLAQLLKKNNPTINVTVYERDANDSAREQGYAIGLNHTGLQVLEPIMDLIPNLSDMFNPLNSFSDFILTEKDLREVARMSFPTGQGRLVSRWGFRACLAQGLNVLWNKKLLFYQEMSDRVVAHFGDGTKAEADLLIGCDGCRSVVRNQKWPEITYEDLGVTSMTGMLLLSDSSASKRLRDLLKQGFLRIFGDEGHTMLMCIFRRDSEKVYLLWSMSYHGNRTDWSHLVGQNDKLKSMLIEKAGKFFSFEIQKLIEETPPPLILNPRQMHSSLPEKLSRIDLSIKPNRVVLLGDAAHPMTTHRGLGANTALADAFDLAAAISAPDWKQAFWNYEKKMMKRGRSAVRDSLQSTNMIHTRGWLNVKIRNLVFWLLCWLVWGIGHILAIVSNIKRLKAR